MRKLTPFFGVCIIILMGISLALGASKSDEEMKRDLQAIKKALQEDKDAPKWLRIEVLGKDEQVRVNVPIQVVLAFLDAAVEIGEASAKEAKEQTRSEKKEEEWEHIQNSISIMKQFTPRQWIQWLKKLPNGEIVTVESKDEKIRIWVE